LTEFDAHYFPELVTPVSRLSEPKNFRMSPDDPDDVTVVCAEVPCWFDDETWCASDEELRDRVVSTLAPLGFPFVEPIRTEVRRIPRCYPVYSGTYGDDLTTIEQWVATQTRLLTFGRQGLFAPDNTHHALVMGRAAADALRPDGTFDAVGWSSSRESFRSHVVED
jgi:protoporphyrinogen oxidase